MITDLPRLLIISEVPFNPNGFGANRTLVNLFDEYPVEKLLLLTPDTSQNSNSLLKEKSIYFRKHYIPFFNNRIGNYINPLISSVNLQILHSLPIVNLKTLEKFLPQIILICPLSSWSLLMGYKVVQHFKRPYLIYLMDDWLALINIRWISNHTQGIAKKLLKNATGWLMISDFLELELKNRYHIKPQHSLVVHNPVNVVNEVNVVQTKKYEDTFQVVYAGSINPLHYDALVVVSQAVYHLRCQNYNIELVLYTDQFFWDYYQEIWEKFQVCYGSFIPYERLNSYLTKADILLVASSFNSQYAHAIRSSLFTKVTDYMAAGKLILSVGPSYSACNKFIKEWKCGLVCETNDFQEISRFLIKIIDNFEFYQQLGKFAIDICNTNFSKTIICQNLFSFIKRIVKSN